MRRTAAWFGGSAVLAVVVAALGGGGAAAADSPEAQSSLVEDFAYPGTAEIQAQHGLTVFRGDGHIQFDSSAPIEEDVPCAPGLIQVEADLEGSVEGVFYCFRTSGDRGFLTMRVPHTFLLRGGSETVTATAELPGADKVIIVAPGEAKPMAPGGDPNMLPEAILVELRFGDW